MIDQPVKQTLKTVSFSFFLVLLLFTFPMSGQQKKPLEYQVSVNALVVPFFAVDGKGNPVYDIRADELELTVNGKSFKIDSFKRFQFDAADGKTTAAAKPKRVLFLIIDTVFTSKTGIRRGKEIACELVRKASPGDRFIVLLNAAVGGLRYLIGPENNAELLIKTIKGVREIPLHRATSFYQARGLPQVDSENRRFQRNRMSARMRNQADIRRFAHILGQFKYALKTISLPKIVFLISQGVGRESFQEEYSSGVPGDETVDPEQDIKRNFVFKTYLFDYFKRVAKSINFGGSVLYAIDPSPPKDYDDTMESGRMSLMFLAGESGGKYFAGRNTVKVVKQIKKTTAAYYEIYFTSASLTKEKMDIHLSCKRQGVRVHSLNHTEKDRSYRNMETVQKKIFGLNVVTGGEWSRMVGKVVRVKYKKTKKNNTADTVTVGMPQKMRNRPVDVFVFYIEPKTQKVDVSFASVQGAHPLHITMKQFKGKHRFFAVIEPVNTYCIYNKVE